MSFRLSAIVSHFCASVCVPWKVLLNQVRLPVASSRPRVRQSSIGAELERKQVVAPFDLKNFTRRVDFISPGYANLLLFTGRELDRLLLNNQLRVGFVFWPS